MFFTEDTFEQAVIELLEGMGYTHIYAPDMNRTDFSSSLLDSVLQDSLVRINKGLPLDAILEAVNKVKNFDTGSQLQKNIQFMDYLQNGIPVRYYIKGEERNSIVYLLDYTTPNNNTFYAVNQFTYIENGENRRPDIIVFVNGLPLVLMELKTPSKDEVSAENAYNQIRNYMKDIPSMFYYNAFCVISDLSTNKAGTITSGLDRFMEWKTKDGSYENTEYAQFDTFYEGMFERARLLDIIKNFILFSNESPTPVKILAGYHQYFAVHKAIEKAKIATKTDGKGGVFWHTQGSGKSLSMVFYAHLLQDALDSPTIVVMTDRIDLDDQLYSQFAKCAGFLRQSPVQATSKEDLTTLLENRTANGIIFTTMFKFEKGDKPLSERRNIESMVSEQIRAIYKISNELEKMFPGRHFTPDGHMVGSIGEVLVADKYRLNLLDASAKTHDAVDSHERYIQIKATQIERISISSEPDYLIVIKIEPDGTCFEVYNGPGAPVWKQAGKLQKNGQRSISLAKIKRLSNYVADADKIK